MAAWEEQLWADLADLPASMFADFYMFAIAWARSDRGRLEFEQQRSEQRSKKIARALDPSGSRQVLVSRQRAWKAARRFGPAIGGTITNQFVAFLYRLPECACYWCGCASKPTIEHVMPFSRGGAHHISNIQPSCVRCNSQKGGKTATEFLEWLRQRGRQAALDTSVRDAFLKVPIGP